MLPRKVRGKDGFDVINPIYCYEGGKTSFKNLFNGEDAMKVERAAIILNRGWIPSELRDRSSRPMEINSKKLIKVKGCFRKGTDLHDYKYPNNPDNNEWHNLALEDIGIYWDIPNFDEAKFYYFHAVDLGGDANNFQKGSGVKVITKDELIEEHYGWRWNEDTHNACEKVFGAISAGAFALAFFAV